MNEPLQQRWYHGITRYQWFVLFIASAGWAFDVFEGQIFVASMREAMPSLLKVGKDHELVSKWNDWAFGSFLLGGAFGGVLFGILADRIGRSKTMILTILFYSLFTCVTALAQSPSQMVALRFLVAMGVGGEWAVASAMVAEVMPKRSRPVMSSIFHASSVFGTLMAAGVGATIVGNPGLGASAWRWGFAIGVVPALLTLLIRWKLKDPEQWVKAREVARQDANQKTGRLIEIFQGEQLRSTLVGVSLASIGLVTFWGGHIYGKNALLRHAEQQALDAELAPWAFRRARSELTENGKFTPGSRAQQLYEGTQRSDATFEGQDIDELIANHGAMREILATGSLNQGALNQYGDFLADKEKKQEAYKIHDKDIKQAEMLSMTLNTLGGGLGLVFFGSISTYLGRKKTFILYHALAFLLMIFLFKGLIANNASALALSLTLPVFGFFTLGMHAGYAVYFPELYPTRLRSTGAGFCFNMGRLATAAAFFGFGYITITDEDKALWLAPLYLVGVIIVLFARETRDQELPD